MIQSQIDWIIDVLTDYESDEGIAIQLNRKTGENTIYTTKLEPAQ